MRKIQFSNESSQENNLEKDNEVNQNLTISEKIREDIEKKVREELEKELCSKRQELQEEIDQTKKELEDLRKKEKIRVENEIRKEYSLLQEKLEEQYRQRKEELDEQIGSEEEALEKIKQAKQKLEDEYEQKIQKLDDSLEVKRAKAEIEIEKMEQEAQRKIQIANLKNAEQVAIEKKNKRLEELLLEYKRVLKKIAQRNISLQEVHKIYINSEKKESQNKVTKPNETIQLTEIIKDDKGIFECSNTGDWFEIGQIILEVKSREEEFQFSNNKILELLSHYNNDEIFSEGILINHGKRINIIAVRIDCNNENNHKNVYKFYSDSRIISIYNLLSISNFILHLHQTRFEPQKKGIGIDFNLNCLVCSNKKHKNSKNCTYRNISQDLYDLKYKISEHKDLGNLALKVYTDLDCTKREVPKEIQEENEERAFTINIELEEDENYLERLKQVAKNEEIEIE